MEEKSVRIWYGEQYVALSGGRWLPSMPEVTAQANLANALSRLPYYEYSPAHGAFGPLLAAQIAARTGGRVEVPRSGGGQAPDGIIF